MQVELIGFYGSDRTHAQSAWTSTVRDLTDEKKERVPRLLRYLAENDHLTPFEKSSFHFLVRCDMATHIHLLKHRIGVSINAESARYKELKENDAYIPDDWPDTWKDKLRQHSEEGNRLYRQAVEELTPTIGRQRAKESGRYFKCYSSMITCDIMFNFRSFLHFYQLRASPHAQVEVRNIATTMLQLINDIPGEPFKNTLAAFDLLATNK